MRKTRHGFTIVEILIVVMIIGILSAVGIPSFVSTRAERTAWAAADRIRADLEWARTTAVNTSVRQTIRFTSTTAQYSWDGWMDPDYPTKPYIVDLKAGDSGVEINSLDFGGDGVVVFDANGLPDSGGVVLIQSGQCTTKVVLNAATGQVDVY